MLAAGTAILINENFRIREQNNFVSFYLVSTERSHILKQNGSFQLQVCLGMCGFLVNNKH